MSERLAIIAGLALTVASAALIVAELADLWRDYRHR